MICRPEVCRNALLRSEVELFQILGWQDGKASALCTASDGGSSFVRAREAILWFNRVVVDCSLTVDVVSLQLCKFTVR